MTGLRINRRQALLATGALVATPRRLLGAGLPSLRAVLTRTECIDRPLGLETLQPRFSWALESAAHSVRQQAYHLRVASDPVLLSGSRADL